jgi:integrase
LAGLRASEIRGLCWGDLDLQGGSVTVRQRADRFGQIGSPKSEDARRTVPIGPELVRILKEWRLASDPGHELVFATRKGTPHLLGNLRRRVLDGVPLHALRHFYASWSLDRGVPLTTLQRRMGHSSILLTADRYGHLLETSADERRDLAAAEARLLRGKDAARGDQRG